MPRRQPPRIGLALGAGSARGWAHIGVIRALQDAGIQPALVCGTSMGALVGAVYANGDLDWLEDWATQLTWQAVVRMLDIRFSGGLLGGAKLIEFFGQRFADKDISELQLPFSAIATELESGREVWLQEGSVMDSVRASIAIPGLFTPVLRQGVWVVDGGLVNPVPVSVAQAMGADIVIAVDLNNDILNARSLGSPLPAESSEAETESEDGATSVKPWRGWLKAVGVEAGLTLPVKKVREPVPSLLTAVEQGISIMQVRITRSRLAGEPADILITPRLGAMGFLDFHRAGQAIEEGRAAVERMMPAIKAQIGLDD
jgi:NTE family protein